MLRTLSVSGLILLCFGGLRALFYFRVALVPFPSLYFRPISAVFLFRATLQPYFRHVSFPF